MKVNIRLKCEGPITVEVPDGAENLEDLATQIGEYLEAEARIGEFVEFVHADVEAADAGDDVEIAVNVNETDGTPPVNIAPLTWLDGGAADGGVAGGKKVVQFNWRRRRKKKVAPHLHEELVQASLDLGMMLLDPHWAWRPSLPRGPGAGEARPANHVIDRWITFQGSPDPLEVFQCPNPPCTCPIPPPRHARAPATRSSGSSVSPASRPPA